MLDKLVLEIQQNITTLESSSPNDTCKKDIGQAKTYIEDATQAKLVNIFCSLLFPLFI